MAPSALEWFLLNLYWRRAVFNRYPATVRLPGRGAAGGP